jgi:polyphosphate kinase 2 (PPK2 family)
MNFCTKDEDRKFLELCPWQEKVAVGTWIELIKTWFESSEKEQKRRKLIAVDLFSRSKWFENSRARDQMFEATDKRTPLVVLARIA